MQESETISPSRSTQGLILMIIAMLTIPIVDGIAKHLSTDYSPLFLSWARYAVASLVVLPFTATLHGPNIFPAERQKSHILRTIFLVSAMTLYFLAIARIPLATAVSAYFVGPIIAVVLSLIILKEQLTARKSLSLIIGFVGSIVILRPDGSLEPGILLALGAGVFFAFYLIATRQAALDSDPVKTLAFQCVVGVILLTPQALATWTTPALNDLLFFAGLGIVSAISHILSIIAFRFADASTLSPLVYVELIGAAIIGYLAFNEIPEANTMIGAALISAAGLILLQRQNRTPSADSKLTEQGALLASKNP